jgi:thiol-disulfide isomerase/thioredoxin
MLVPASFFPVMKTILFLNALLTSLCLGAYENWTSKDGRTAQIELVKTTGDGETLAGEFLMKNGNKVTLKAADLDDTSAAKLKEAAAAEKAAMVTPSVFDEILEGQLVKLDRKKLRKCNDATAPKKYYIFYYTASWCPPCQAFTPSLVAFYNDHKKDNSNFELVLITSDRDKDQMEKYAVAKQMPWPQLKMSEVSKFKQKFNHGVTGIPSVVVCDLQGNIVAKTSDLNALKELVK